MRQPTSCCVRWAAPSFAMSALYYTLTAIVLYVFSDWLLQRIEVARGARFAYRSAYFFVILLGSALVTFSVIRHVAS